MSSFARATLLALSTTFLVIASPPVAYAQQSIDDSIETTSLSAEATLKEITSHIISGGVGTTYEFRDHLSRFPVEESTAALLGLLTDESIKLEARTTASIYDLLYLLEFDKTTLADEVIRAAEKGMDAEETSIRVNALNVLGKPNSANLDLAVETLVRVVEKFGLDSSDGVHALGKLSSRVLPRHKEFSTYFLSIFEETNHPFGARGYAILAFAKVAPLERALNILEESELPGKIATLSAITMVALGNRYAHHEDNQTATISDLQDRAKIRLTLEKLFANPDLDSTLQEIQLKDSGYSKSEMLKVLILTLDVTLGANAHADTDEQKSANRDYKKVAQKMADGIENEPLKQALLKRVEMFDDDGGIRGQWSW